jgi:hypothetical protein
VNQRLSRRTCNQDFHQPCSSSSIRHPSMSFCLLHFRTCKRTSKSGNGGIVLNMLHLPRKPAIVRSLSRSQQCAAGAGRRTMPRLGNSHGSLR